MSWLLRHSEVSVSWLLRHSDELQPGPRQVPRLSDWPLEQPNLPRYYNACSTIVYLVDLVEVAIQSYSLEISTVYFLPLH